MGQALTIIPKAMGPGIFKPPEYEFEPDSKPKESNSKESSPKPKPKESSSSSWDKVRTLKHKWAIRDFANAHLATDQKYIDSEIFGNEDMKFFLRLYTNAEAKPNPSIPRNWHIGNTNINVIINGQVIQPSNDSVSLYVHCVYLSEELESKGGIKIRTVCTVYGPYIGDKEKTATLKVGQRVGWDQLFSRTEFFENPFRKNLDLKVKIHFGA